MAHAGGRPRKYDSTEQIDQAMQYYFDSITRTEPAWESVLIGYEDEEQKKPIHEKRPVLNNAGEQIENTHYFEIPSIISMCLHLGITRETLLQYEHQEKFSDTIMRAKAKIERYNADQLHRKDQVNGIIFNLKNNFGWKDKQELEHTGKDGGPITTAALDYSQLSTEQLLEIIAKAKKPD